MKGTVALCILLALVCGCAKKAILEPEGSISRSDDSSNSVGFSGIRIETIPVGPVIKPDNGPVPSPQAAEPSLETIYFPFDSQLLDDAAKGAVERNYLAMQRTPEAKFVLEGHCDERASDMYNLALGELRARGVYNYLITRGIDGGRLTFVSYGEEKPADFTHNEAAWARNRRVEVLRRISADRE